MLTLNSASYILYSKLRVLALLHFVLQNKVYYSQTPSKRPAPVKRAQSLETILHYIIVNKVATTINQSFAMSQKWPLTIGIRLDYMYLP